MLTPGNVAERSAHHIMIIATIEVVRAVVFTHSIALVVPQVTTNLDPSYDGSLPAIL